MLKKLDLIFCAGILLIMVGHVISVFYFFQPLVDPGAVGPAREPSLWWVSGGVGFWFVAGLNFLRIRYSGVVPTLNAVCFLFNAVLFLYVCALMVNSPQFLLYERAPLLICLAGVFVFSARALSKNRLLPS